MKNSQQGFIVPILIIIIVVLAIGGGAYIYQNKKIKTPTTSINNETNTFTNSSQDTQQPPKKTVLANTDISTNFVSYNSLLGFSIAYPKSWTVEKINGEGYSLGGVRVQSPGTSLKSSNLITADDKLEQYVRVDIGTLPISFEQLKNNQIALLQKQIPGIKHQIVDQKNIEINGITGYEVVYTENNSTNNIISENIVVELPSKISTLNTQTGNHLNTITTIEYRANQNVFDRSLAEKVIGTYKDSIK